MQKSREERIVHVRIYDFIEACLNDLDAQDPELKIAALERLGSVLSEPDMLEIMLGYGVMSACATALLYAEDRIQIKGLEVLCALVEHCGSEAHLYLTVPLLGSVLSLFESDNKEILKTLIRFCCAWISCDKHVRSEHLWDEAVVRLLMLTEDSDSAVRLSAMEAMHLMLAEHPERQAIFLEHQGITSLLRGSLSDSESLRCAGLRVLLVCVSSAAHAVAAQQQSVHEGVIEILMMLLSDSDRATVALVGALLSVFLRHPDHRAFCVSLDGFPIVLEAFATSNDRVVREHLAAALSELLAHPSLIRHQSVPSGIQVFIASMTDHSSVVRAAMFSALGKLARVPMIQEELGRSHGWATWVDALKDPDAAVRRNACMALHDLIAPERSDGWVRVLELGGFASLLTLLGDTEAEPRSSALSCLWILVSRAQIGSLAIDAQGIKSLLDVFFGACRKSSAYAGCVLCLLSSGFEANRYITEISSLPFLPETLKAASDLAYRSASMVMLNFVLASKNRNLLVEAGVLEGLIKFLSFDGVSMEVLDIWGSFILEPCIAKIATEQGVGALCGLLEHEDPKLRLRAVWVLCQLACRVKAAQSLILKYRESLFLRLLSDAQEEIKKHILIMLRMLAEDPICARHLVGCGFLPPVADMLLVPNDVLRMHVVRLVHLLYQQDSVFRFSAAQHAVLEALKNTIQDGGVHETAEYIVVLARREETPSLSLLGKRSLFERPSVALRDVEDTMPSVPFSALTPLTGLGGGSFSKVYSVLYEGRIYALKTYARMLVSDAEFDKVQKELKKQYGLQNPYVMRMVASVTGRVGQVRLLMHYKEGGSLYQYLRQESRSLSLRLRIARDLLRGLVYIHERGMLHKNISSLKALVDGEGRVCWSVLSVQGLSLKSHDIYRSIPSEQNPLRWMAPEAVLDGMFTEQGDMWSYGMLLFELMYERVPYHTLTVDQVLIALQTHRGASIDESLAVPSNVVALMQSCWQPLGQRASSASALNVMEAEALSP